MASISPIVIFSKKCIIIIRMLYKECTILKKRCYSMLSPAEKKTYNEMFSALTKHQHTFHFNGLSHNTLSRIFNALLDDNPRFFWLTGDTKYKWTERGNTIADISCKAVLVPGITTEMLDVMNTKLKNTVRDIIIHANQKKSHFEKILYVHDYIVDTTTYVSDAPMCYNAYGCLVLHQAVCAGYAKAFQLVMEEMGYECGYVCGADKEKGTIHSSHAWNYIKIEGEYYFVDTTWDDPTVEIGNYNYDNKTRNYFCISERDISHTHIISNPKNYPVCNGSKYNYHIYKGYFLPTYSFSEVSRIASEQLRITDKFTVKFSSKAEANRAINDLIDNQKVYRIPQVAGSITYTVSKSGLIITIQNTR